MFRDETTPGAGSASLAVVGAVCIVVTALLGGVPADTAIGVASAVLLLEYGAVAVAIGLGLPPVPAAAYVGATGSTLILVLFALLDLLADRSTLVDRLLQRAQRRTRTMSRLGRYGPIALVPAVMVAGFFVCVPLAWLLGWRRSHAVAALLAGFCIATACTAAVSSGLLAAL